LKEIKFILKGRTLNNQGLKTHKSAVIFKQRCCVLILDLKASIKCAGRNAEKTVFFGRVVDPDPDSIRIGKKMKKKMHFS
jgi:hypothetical protein